jgi:hypothetical protein
MSGAEMGRWERQNGVGMAERDRHAVVLDFAVAIVLTINRISLFFNLSYLCGCSSGGDAFVFGWRS